MAYAVGQSRESQETTLASCVSPGMAPLAMKSCQSPGFPVCGMGSLLPASRTVRSQEMAGEWSQGVEPARTQNFPLISSQTPQCPFWGTCPISCQDLALTAFMYSLTCLQQLHFHDHPVFLTVASEAQRGNVTIPRLPSCLNNGDENIREQPKLWPTPVSSLCLSLPSPNRSSSRGHGIPPAKGYGVKIYSQQGRPVTH